jgi:hypothetical protein
MGMEGGLAVEIFASHLLSQTGQGYKIMPTWEYIELCLVRHDKFAKGAMGLGGEKRDIEHYQGCEWKWSDGNTAGVATHLNTLGAQGWELVSAYPQNDDFGMAWAGRTSKIYYLLKRQTG